MACSKPIPCGPCQEENVKTEADIWCYNCDEGLCSACLGHHKRFKGTRDHKTIDIKSYKPSIQAIRTECEKHGQQLILYCPSHLKPCCDECISISHSKCTGIKSLASVAETKIEISKESVEKVVDSTLYLMDKIVNIKSINIKEGEQQCEGIKESVLNISNKVSKYLDHFNKMLFQKVGKLLDQEKTKATDFINEIKGKRIILQNIKDHLQSVKTNTSKLESFLGVHQIEKQVNQYQRYVEDLETDERVHQFDIQFEQNDEIEEIINKLGILECMGEVKVVKSKVVINSETSVKRTAQVKSRDQSIINNMEMSLDTKMRINCIQKPSAMICLTDESFIIVQSRRYSIQLITLTTSSGLKKEELHIYSDSYEQQMPCSVSYIGGNTIAITFPILKSIKTFNMRNKTVTKVIKLDKKCYGLSFSENSLVVGLNDDEIRVIDLEGNKLKSIQVQSGANLVFFVYCNDRVIYNDYVGKAVNCVDRSGNQIWQYTQDLLQPRGLCIDTRGNIIVADMESNTLRVISKDGQDSKVLLRLNDKLQVQFISFEHVESSYFICDYNGIYLAKLKLYYA